MNTQKMKSPTWFTLLSILALLWNLLGVFAYLSSVFITEEMIATLPQAQQEVFAATPVWVNGAFAVAVWFGLLAAIALLMKRRIAKFLFQISFTGIFVQQMYTFFFIDSVGIYGIYKGVVMPAMVLFIGAILILITSSALEKGWIK